MQAEDDDAASRLKSVDKTRRHKQRKTKSSTPLSAPAKPCKATGPKKEKGSKLAPELKSHVSKGLMRTKPLLSGTDKIPPKTEKPSRGRFLENSSGTDLKNDTLAASDRNENGEIDMKHSRRSGLGDKYQAAYANESGCISNLATPPKSDEPALPSNNLDKGPERDSQVGQSGRAVSHIACEPVRYREIIVRDFEMPPFTQTTPPKCRTQAAHAPGPFDDAGLLALNPSGSSEADEGDEYPMDDQCFEEMMQSRVSAVEQDKLEFDWPPTCSDDIKMGDDPWNDPSQWPEVVSDIDGVTIYDQEHSNVEKLIDSDISSSSPQLNSQISCVLTHISGNAREAQLENAKAQERLGDCFIDDDIDNELIELTADKSINLGACPPLTPPCRSPTPKLQWMSPKLYIPVKPTQAPVSSVEVPHLVPIKAEGVALPFMRPPFPKPIRDRSPIMGLTNRTVLRTCFRIGEALNAAAAASRTNVDAIIELYARILLSEREGSGGYKQYFQFADLFTDKPPYLSATYSLWKGVPLWDSDSKVFLGDQGKGRMARAMGRIKRCEQGGGCEMVVMSIWEVDWEDVGVAKGIVCF